MEELKNLKLGRLDRLGEVRGLKLTEIFSHNKETFQKRDLPGSL